MPFLSVTDAGAAIPSKVGRKQLHFRNEGPDPVRYAFESDASEGFLLNINEGLALGGADLGLNSAIHFITDTAETATISYTEHA
jgi:hypothetical protein